MNTSLDEKTPQFNEIASHTINDRVIRISQYNGCAETMLILSVGNMRLMAVITIENNNENCLHVSYKEKAYANGKIPSGFSKRESTTTQEILISRLVDRSLRPLISSERCVNLNLVLLGYDKSIDIKSWAVWLGGIAIARSGIKIQGPIAAITLSLNKGSCFIARTPNGITAVDIKSQPITIHELFSHIISKSDCNELWNISSNLCTFYTPPTCSIEMINQITNKAITLSDMSSQKFYNEFGVEPMLFNKIASLYASTLPRDDKRKFDECRHIACSADVLPTAHGSALFTRGKTAVLATITSSDNPRDCVINDGVSKHNKDLFYVHYEFPGYCTNESNRKSVSRREIGHGMIVQNALKHIVNSQSTTRLTTDVISADGSSSMASVCAGSLALYKKTKKLVGGISVGSFDDQLIVDLTAQEDAISNMDCKVAADDTGRITAVQMDVKSLISPQRFYNAIEKATDVILTDIIPIMRKCD